MKFKNMIILLLLGGCPSATWAQTIIHDTVYIAQPRQKSVVKARMIGIGSSNILDTYLSPEKYSGPEVRYLSHTTYRKTGSRMSTQVINQGSLAYTDNRSGEGREMAGAYNFGWGRHYNWDLMDGNLNLKAGIMAELTLGFIYNTRNSNNPAQAKAMFDISPNASAQYKFRVARRALTVRYELNLPLAGLMFSPNYGQSYYEIFSKGNYDHNIVPTWPGNAPSMRQLLTLDFNIGRRMLRVGYLGDFQQARVNHLKQHIYSNAFIVGLIL
ncbi:DUF3316 domain-containing protein [Prevotella sp.]|uniref:DUF3316 domain-containing protein n=1 Tax=Prevotella sp. TaxID=59823 RepID=UPI002F92FD45